MNPISSFYSFSSFLCGTFPFDLSVIPILFLSHSVPGAETNGQGRRLHRTREIDTHTYNPAMPLQHSQQFQFQTACLSGRLQTKPKRKKRNSHQMKKQESHNS
jgi:hypothetical protein